MDFGILFTSHPNIDIEPYPHRGVHARVTSQIIAADKLGYDCAWLAEHHFSNKYGIMPDVNVYMGYLAGLTKTIKLGAGIVTLPLNNPVRVVENAALLDILTNGRVAIGFGSGYRPYEFEGLGVPFEERRDIQEEALPLILELFSNRRATHKGKYFNITIPDEFEIFPQSIQQPYPPLYLAAATERSLATAGEMGFGLMLSSLTPIADLAKDVARYKEALERAPAHLRKNPAFGDIDVARWVYVAETDEQAKRDSEAGILRHFAAFDGKQTVGYLGTTRSKSGQVQETTYDNINQTTIIHGSPATVRDRIKDLHAKTGFTSMMLHFPPYYGSENTMKSLELFAKEVMPALKQPKQAAAE
ncbi:LLM class flavin-dependent oxidoreductase [Rhodoligotrophos ferricapiens]|uniref:LLM class flavin-dependent oxidoreductase n=1 Tax=Rhodoligotrophos ferricapiens TaxID=3069264 RepID=UPI00315D429D